MFRPIAGTSAATTKKYTYNYTDTNWKDKLTSFDGKAITYDAIGNPLTYNGYTFAWEQGRQLKSITGNSKTISYKYNDSGIRTEKTVNGIVTKYNLVGDKVTYEENGTDKIYYTYDSSDNLVSMNLNGVEYYYIRNAQNDIIGLFDKAGTQVVSYSYDTWGKLISIDGSLKDSVGIKNEYRYRGYRYDTETGLYYLQSRYYNPDWGRFINADALGGRVGQLLSHNVFAYCKNNPVNMADADGEWPRWLINGAQAVVDFAQGVGAGILEGLTYGISGSLDSAYARDNERTYLAGKVLGNAVTAVGGGLATVASGTGAIVTSPTGVGAVAGGAAAVYSAGVTASALRNFSKNTVKFAKTEKMGRIKGNAPRNNQVQNKQFQAVVKEFGLSKKEQRLLHDSITGQGYGYEDIREEAISLFPRLQK